MAPVEEIGLMTDVPIVIEVELDRRIMPLCDILGLTQGSIIKMTRSAGENINISVGGTLIGFGEIVIIEESVGVRITDFVEEGSA